MKKRAGAVSIAYTFSIGLSALAVAWLPSVARAQSADLVLCDRVAAEPADPDKPAGVRGVKEIAQTDVATAIKFCKIASAGSRRALYQLGRAYAANQQLPEALSAYRKAADKGSTSAMVELGVLYGTGVGVAKDEVQARKLFQRAADAGNPRGVSNLAAIGGGSPLDSAKARALLSKGAVANSAAAEYQLGVMMADGLGGPKDDV
ncbi:MAG TPA: tetratricopeptide repeat protein, partial [Xanthobacteraceae bacterium]